MFFHHKLTTHMETFDFRAKMLHLLHNRGWSRPDMCRRDNFLLLSNSHGLWQKILHHNATRVFGKTLLLSVLIVSGLIISFVYRTLKVNYPQWAVTAWTQSQQMALLKTALSGRTKDPAKLICAIMVPVKIALLAPPVIKGTSPPYTLLELDVHRLILF